MANELPELESIVQFLFETPPYETVSATPEVLSEFYSIDGKRTPVDGHCPFCNRESTFEVRRIHVSNTEHRADISKRMCINEEITIQCARNEGHVIRYFFRKLKLTLQKIGQFPSLADIANDEVAQYRKNMDKLDANEFHKAIGLAAHGVGVGSFVYLRRVFERLIYGRFKALKDQQGWDADEFIKLRMVEKIEFLKGHIPDFIHENKKIYSILSVGMHELDEKSCLSWFEVMKQSIIIILEDDKKKKEELDRRTAFSRAIESFGVAK